MTDKKKNILVIAGESSGDQHAAAYIEEHSKVNKNISFVAYGQSEIKKTSANVIYDTEEISVVGIIEVLAKYNKIMKALKAAKKYIYDNKPNLIVLVDYVEFNLKVARYAKSLNIPVLFYVAPQVWAWREKRSKTFIDSIDYLAVIFPFEEIFFKKYTKNVSYVGHPLSDKVDLINSVKVYQSREIDLGIFPGSRESEIKNNLFTMLDCVQKNKDERIAIFYADETSKYIIKELLPEEYHKCLISGKDIDQVSNCKKALCASGTITLQLAILDIPMVIMYKLSYISYFIMKKLLTVKYIGLVNLILGSSIGDKPIVKEFIQPTYNDQVSIMVELNSIDNDEAYRNKISVYYKEIREKLSEKPSESLVSVAERMLNLNG
jgi:lipid-A-disaccharide synthase